VKEVEIEVTEEYRRRHFKEGKFYAEGPAADALGMLTQDVHLKGTVLQELNRS
jgi:hypothetical protein